MTRLLFIRGNLDAANIRAKVFYDNCDGTFAESRDWLTLAEAKAAAKRAAANPLIAEAWILVQVYRGKSPRWAFAGWLPVGG